MNRRGFFGSLLGICSAPVLAMLPEAKPDIASQIAKNMDWPTAEQTGRNISKMYNFWVTQETEMIALSPNEAYLIETRKPLRDGLKPKIYYPRVA